MICCLLLTEIDCGDPFFKPHTKMLWDGTSQLGSVVYYQCEEGYYTRSPRNFSVCGESGLWEDTDVWCEGAVFTDVLRKTHFKTRSWCFSLQYTVCSKQKALTHVLCAEITCGPPLYLPHTNLLWDGTSRPGSVVMYECMDGFHQESGSNKSTCLRSGEWGKVSVKCQGTVIVSTH